MRSNWNESNNNRFVDFLLSLKFARGQNVGKAVRTRAEKSSPRRTKNEYVGNE